MVLSSQNRRSAIFLLSRLVTKRKKIFANNTSLKVITRRTSNRRNAQHCSEKTIIRGKIMCSQYYTLYEKVLF